MSHEIMSVKLCELDERIARLHSRVRLTEATDTAALRREVKALERQCAETALTLRQKLSYTRSAIAGELCETYETAENRMDGMRQRLAGLIARSEARRRRRRCWRSTPWTSPCWPLTGHCCFP